MAVVVGFHLPIEQVDEILLEGNDAAVMGPVARGEQVVVIALKSALAVSGDVDVVTILRPQNVVSQRDVLRIIRDPHAVAGRHVKRIAGDPCPVGGIGDDTRRRIPVDDVVVDHSRIGGRTVVRQNRGSVVMQAIEMYRRRRLHADAGDVVIDLVGIAG